MVACLELFWNEVFDGEGCSAELEAIGRSIAESCKGLPLAIITTAGNVTKRERSEDAWEEIMNLLPYWRVAEDKKGSEGMMKILKFSYDDLPNKMKKYFLYLGVFPEDEEIRVRDLISLWMAEGFIEAIQTGRSKAPPQPEDIEGGAIPCLRHAVFHKCPGLKLNYLPDQMRSLGCNLEFTEDDPW
ncbi:hypothetical protein PIB30_040674 [Stylosanthes scabra]|uniref:Disease resistance protein winged helix domain-containing protein n=1 Tax=Stylosanthes scabra TaxID=79078 RepID=A0ABU6QF63_9FABA|nr:hypothetical protein [Stylosanthes scabra]